MSPAFTQELVEVGGDGDGLAAKICEVWLKNCGSDLPVASILPDGS